MVNRGYELPSNPLIEAALNAAAECMDIYRYTFGSLQNEFGLCEPSSVFRMAQQIGLPQSELDELESEGSDTANLLKDMLVALRIQPKLVADTDTFIRRELQWQCLTCSNKKKCKHELAKGTAANDFREFCPNAASLDELMCVATPSDALINA